MQFGIGQTGSPVSLSLNWYIPKKKNHIVCTFLMSGFFHLTHFWD